MQLAKPLALRAERAHDRAFLLDLYVSTRDDLGPVVSDAEWLARLLSIQLEAREAQYRKAFPEAAFDLILYEGEPIGRLVVDRSGTEILLVDVALVPASRERGFGTRVLRALIEEAEATERAIRLHVLGTSRARDLYTRLGFVETGDDGVRVGMCRPARASAGSPGSALPD